jgi:hypothetical protein
MRPSRISTSTQQPAGQMPQMAGFQVDVAFASGLPGSAI